MWQKDENGLRFHVHIPTAYAPHRERYIAGFFRGYLKRKQNKPAAPKSERRPFESRLLYRLRTGQI
jgi:hypothetical protein